MTRPRRFPAPADVTATIVPELLGLSLADCEARSILHECRFPQPDSTTGLYCIEDVERCKDVLEVLATAGHERNAYRRASEIAFQAAALTAPDEPSVEQPWAHRRGRVEEHGDVFLHFCVECGRFGPYGYGVHLRTGRLGRWYCRQHRPQDPGSASVSRNSPIGPPIDWNLE
jgi:hypothetical protein